MAAVALVPGQAQQPEPAAVGAEEAPSAIRPFALAHLTDELAGRTVRVRHARVVGVFNPRAFLIESATTFPVRLGTRDRVVVLVGRGALRVAPEQITGESVVVTGVVRTLLGVQLTAEVPWPAELTPESIQRLEVHAAVLASGVHTADGVELTEGS